MDKIIIKNLYKVFGLYPQKAIAMLQQGKEKESVLENAAFGLELANVDIKIRKARAMKALVQVGLEGWEGWEDQHPAQLSGGMQDELLKLQDDNQRAIVFISHDLDEALRIGDRNAIMEGGRVVQVGIPKEILQNPADDYVRAFFRGVDPTSVILAGDIVKDPQLTVIKKKQGGIRATHELLSSKDRDYAYVVD